jgi:sugar transferase (PEP-CTERM/EpsH1 system associated)
MAALPSTVSVGTGGDRRPLAVHVLYSFDTGGLENGVVNLINHMPADGYRHVVVALTQITSFRQRVKRSDVEFIALNKPPGHGIWLYPKLYRLFRRLKPDIVHSRNLAALEVQIPAWLAGVPVRIHGEHGRDVGDLDGSNRTYQRVRKLYRPFVSHYVALSQDLAAYLTAKIGIGAKHVAQIYNGVDISRFAKGQGPVQAIEGCPFSPQSHWIVGTVGRMQTVKDQTTLARAFIHALAVQPALRDKLRLVMVGQGPLRAESLALLEASGVADLAWLPGERDDVPAIMQGLHCFVLPSLAEGISNTILEAMASGLPVIATAVGGNPELVIDGQTGAIVPAGAPEVLAQSIVRFATDPALAAQMGANGRAECERRFSLAAMVGAYQRLYDEQLGLARTTNV